MTKGYSDFPFDEAAAGAAEHIKNGATVFQKFTCVQCGERLTIEDANVFHSKGKCDRCGHVTNIRERGCNYLLVTAFG